MKYLMIIVLCGLGGCASFGCNSTPEARVGAYCQMEAQGLSVHATEFKMEGTPVTRVVRLTAACEEGAAGCWIPATGRIEVLRSVHPHCLQQVVRHELRHKHEGAWHGDRPYTEVCR